MPPKKRVTTPKKALKPASGRVVRRKKTITPAVPSETISEQKIEESKYYAGPVMQKFEEQRGFELPPGYGDNRISVMVRDPYWLYSYWELNEKRVNEIKNELGDRFWRAKLILRVYHTSDWSFFDIQVSGGVGNWYINTGRPNTSYCIDIGYLTEDGVFICAARSNVVTTPRDRMSEVIDEEWMIPDWERMYALSGGFSIGRGSMELKQMMEKNLFNQVSSPGISSWSSPSRPPQPRPFWLVANCELIVYGATEPTAEVTVMGQPIKLRPDGTFSLRFALPDGKQSIPIEATREDGAEKRRITPIVERKTE
jgi:hypothetical protein